MKLILVAAGETILDQQNRTQGWSDSPLTESGIQHAKILKEKLFDIKIDKVYCSSSERAIDTAEIIVENRSIELNVDRRLKDINYGTFEATPNYIKDTYFQYSDTSNLDFSEAGGENIDQFNKRLKCIMDDIIAQSNRIDCILIVTHKNAIDMILSIYMNIRVEDIKYIDKNNNYINLICDYGIYKMEVKSCN